MIIFKAKSVNRDNLAIILLIMLILILSLIAIILIVESRELKRITYYPTPLKVGEKAYLFTSKSISGKKVDIEVELSRCAAGFSIFDFYFSAFI